MQILDAVTKQLWRRWLVRADVLKFMIGPDLKLCAVTIAAMLLLAFTDILGVAFVVPMLGLPGEAGLARLPIIGSVVTFTSEMTVRERMLFTAAALALVVVLRIGIQYVALYLKSELPSAIETRLGYECYRRLQQVQLRYVHTKEFAELATVLVSYPNRAGQIVLGVVTIISQALAFGMFFAALLMLKPWIAVLSLAMLGVVSIVIKLIFHKRLENAGRQQNAVSIASTQLVYETFNANKLIRLRNSEGFFLGRFAKSLREIGRTKRRLAFLNGSTAPMFTMASGLTLAFIIFISAVATTPTEADTAALLVFLLVMTRLAAPLNAISTSLASMRSMVPALAHFLTLVEEMDSRIQSRGTVPFKKLETAIVFDNVVLRFDADESPALNGLTLKIEPGKRVGIVGTSGAGKSSIVNVLTRLYEYDGGKILIDGVDLPDLRLGDWRENLAVISQDTAILNDSIRNNLLFGRTDIPDEELMRVLEAADAKNFVMEMAEGLDTVLGDRGVRLSGGQQQRLSIARALVQDAPIVIFDEATSSLDSLSEARIQKNVLSKLSGKTVLIVAHRLSTVRDADFIVVMERGVAAEIGNHNELMALKGRYFALVMSQEMGHSAKSPEREAEVAEPPVLASGTAP